MIIVCKTHGRVLWLTTRGSKTNGTLLLPKGTTTRLKEHHLLRRPETNPAVHRKYMSGDRCLISILAYRVIVNGFRVPNSAFTPFQWVMKSQIHHSRQRYIPWLGADCVYHLFRFSKMVHENGTHYTPIWDRSTYKIFRLRCATSKRIEVLILAIFDTQVEVEPYIFAQAPVEESISQTCETIPRGSSK